MKMTKAVGYCRVSTKGQVGEDKYGIDAQRKDILDYCRKNGIEIVEWYIDEGVSGAEVDRPELKKILNGEITNPPVEAVVIAKTDRLSRDIMYYYWFKYAFERMDIKLISVAEDFENAGSFAPIYEAITAAFAEMERTMITKRMSSGRNIKAAKGCYAGGNAPYGYTVPKGSGVLTVNEDEAAVVRQIFALRDGGATLAAICDKLNEAGYTSRSGKPFAPTTIQYIVKNRRTYEGYYKYGKGDWVKGEHEAIL